MRALIFFLLLFSVWALGQERVKGVILSEEGRVIPKVLIINIKTGAKFYTDEQGTFEIEAKVSEEIRGVKEVLKLLKITEIERNENLLKLLLISIL